MKALRDKGVHPLDTLEKRTRLCKYDDRHPRISKRKYLYLPKMYDRSGFLFYAIRETSRDGGGSGSLQRADDETVREREASNGEVR